MVRHFSFMPLFLIFGINYLLQKISTLFLDMTKLVNLNGDSLTKSYKHYDHLKMILLIIF